MTLFTRRLNAKRFMPCYRLALLLFVAVGTNGYSASADPSRATNNAYPLTGYQSANIAQQFGGSQNHSEAYTYGYRPFDPKAFNNQTFNNQTFNNQAFNNQTFNAKTFHQKTIPKEDAYHLPELGNGGERFNEANQYKTIGEWSLQRLNGSAPILADAWTQEQLETLVWQINAEARRQAPLALVVVDNPSINAFAIPGGVMGLHTGTILAAKSLDEVASVVAHEVAHLSQRHYENRGDADKKALLIQIGGLLAAIAASQADGNAATAIMMGSQTAALNSQMAFSRSNEREADRIGMQLMAQAGFDAKAMPQFFATLDQKSQLNQTKQAYLPSFIMTHPLSAERLSDAQSRARDYPTVGFNEQQHQRDFDLLQWRLNMLTQQASETELSIAAKTSPGAALALAYWYGKQGRYLQAQTLLQQAAQIAGNNNTGFEVLAAITQAQVLGMQGKWDKAEALLLPYHRLYPERRDIRLYLSDIWLQQQQYNDALAVLKPLLQSRPYDIEVLSRMQQAFEIMAKSLTNDSKTVTGSAKPVDSDASALATIATSNALRYRALLELWHGQYETALVSIKQAEKVALALDMPIDSYTTTAHQTINVRPLLALISEDISRIKAAKDYHP